MIHEFSVKNYLSFKEEQILSFEATKDTTYSDVFTVDNGNIKLLKFAVVYGANASGKTNLLEALDYLRHLQINPPSDKSSKTKFVPFLLDEKSKIENGFFNLSFFIDDIRYIYSIELNNTLILHEVLKFYPGTQPALLFERTYDNSKNISEIKFGEKLQLNNDDEIFLTKSTLNNTTVIGAFAKSNIHSNRLDRIYKWYQEGMMKIIKTDTKLFNWTSKKIKEDIICKSFLLEMLRKADFNISDITFDKTDIELTEKMISEIEALPIPDNKKQEIISEGKISPEQVIFSHEVQNMTYFLPKELQSEGTLRYYGLGGALNKLIENNTILLIDELENSLHYELVIHFIKTFLVNSKKSQLIITTHDIGLLEAEIIRRDVVWITEKNNGMTDLYSISDFKLHKNISISNAYKIGKLGGKPELGNVYLDSYGKEN